MLRYNKLRFWRFLWEIVAICLPLSSRPNDPTASSSRRAARDSYLTTYLTLHAMKARKLDPESLKLWPHQSKAPILSLQISFGAGRRSPMRIESSYSAGWSSIRP